MNSKFSILQSNILRVSTRPCVTAVKISAPLLPTIFFIISYSFSYCQNIPTPPSKNPFRKFIGEWTLRDDNWSQNWGQGMEHIKIPNHHTICKQLNTDNSLLAVIDGTPPYGHIFWSYNPVKKEVYHLSSFGDIRSGVGKGTVNENGDVTLKVSFEGEPEGTYRIYTYKWVSEHEYEMESVQYDHTNNKTGGFYGGRFVRVWK